MDYHTINKTTTVVNTINNTRNNHSMTINNIYIASNVNSNQVQNNNPSLEETSKFLDKPKPIKNKSLSAICTIILGVAINQIFPQII